MPRFNRSEYRVLLQAIEYRIAGSSTAFLGDADRHNLEQAKLKIEAYLWPALRSKLPKRQPRRPARIPLGHL